MQTIQRRSGTKVFDGRVQTKNNHAETRESEVLCKNLQGEGWSVGFVVEPAGARCRHTLAGEDIERFCRLIPRFASYAEGLQKIALVSSHPVEAGTYQRRERCIQIHAWKRHLEVRLSPLDIEESPHVAFLSSIFPFQHLEPDAHWKPLICETVSEAEAKVFALLHGFLHALGHHVDCMRTSRRLFCPGGEDFADRFALEISEEIWKRVFRAFQI